MSQLVALELALELALKLALELVLELALISLTIPTHFIAVSGSLVEIQLCHLILIIRNVLFRFYFSLSPLLHVLLLLNLPLRILQSRLLLHEGVIQ